MKEQAEVRAKDLVPIDVWVTTNVAIYRQLGMWHDRKKTYTFVPTGLEGFVIVTEHDSVMNCKPLQGYMLFRPCGLELQWLTDKVVMFRELTMSAALSWARHTPSASWKDIGEYQ